MKAKQAKERLWAEKRKWRKDQKKSGTRWETMFSGLRRGHQRGKVSGVFTRPSSAVA